MVVFVVPLFVYRDALIGGPGFSGIPCLVFGALSICPQLRSGSSMSELGKKKSKRKKKSKAFTIPWFRPSCDVVSRRGVAAAAKSGG